MKHAEKIATELGKLFTGVRTEEDDLKIEQKGKEVHISAKHLEMTSRDLAMLGGIVNLEDKKATFNFRRSGAKFKLVITTR
jgi:hypothetical protein